KTGKKFSDGTDEYGCVKSATSPVTKPLTAADKLKLDVSKKTIGTKGATVSTLFKLTPPATSVTAATGGRGGCPGKTDLYRLPRGKSTCLTAEIAAKMDGISQSACDAGQVLVPQNGMMVCDLPGTAKIQVNWGQKKPGSFSPFRKTTGPVPISYNPQLETVVQYATQCGPDKKAYYLGPDQFQCKATPGGSGSAVCPGGWVNERGGKINYCKPAPKSASTKPGVTKSALTAPLTGGRSNLLAKPKGSRSF
ncbi:MAG: hypothetical protein WC718_12785, partial [Phycisphaerales bacterium]